MKSHPKKLELRWPIVSGADVKPSSQGDPASFLGLSSRTAVFRERAKYLWEIGSLDLGARFFFSPRGKIKMKEKTNMGRKERKKNEKKRKKDGDQENHRSCRRRRTPRRRRRRIAAAAAPATVVGAALLAMIIAIVSMRNGEAAYLLSVS